MFDHFVGWAFKGLRNIPHDSPLCFTIVLKMVSTASQNSTVSLSNNLETTHFFLKMLVEKHNFLTPHGDTMSH